MYLYINNCVQPKRFPLWAFLCIWKWGRLQPLQVYALSLNEWGIRFRFAWINVAIEFWISIRNDFFPNQTFFSILCTFYSCQILVEKQPFSGQELQIVLWSDFAPIKYLYKFNINLASFFSSIGWFLFVCLSNVFCE